MATGIWKLDLLLATDHLRPDAAYRLGSVATGVADTGR